MGTAGPGVPPPCILCPQKGKMAQLNVRGGRSESSKTLMIGTMNVRGCSATEGKKELIGRMFVERKFDVLGLTETKVKGVGECEFGCVSGRVSGVRGGRAREGVAVLLSRELQESAVEWRDVSARLMWVKVKFWR